MVETRAGKKIYSKKPIPKGKKLKKRVVPVVSVHDVSVPDVSPVHKRTKVRNFLNLRT